MFSVVSDTHVMAHRSPPGLSRNERCRSDWCEHWHGVCGTSSDSRWSNIPEELVMSPQNAKLVAVIATMVLSCVRMIDVDVGIAGAIVSAISSAHMWAALAKSTR